MRSLSTTARWPLDDSAMQSYTRAATNSLIYSGRFRDAPAVDRALFRRWATDPRLTDAAVSLLTTVHLDASEHGRDWAVFGDVAEAWPLSLGALRAAIRRAVWCG